jgi:phage tail-like protein
MDVNGTRFHLVLGRDDWIGAGLPDGAGWDDRDATFELRRLPFVFPDRHGETPPAHADRRGAGRDRFGNWYWIADDGRGIVSRSPRDRAPVPFWPGEAPPCDPAPPAGDFAPVETPAPAESPRLQGLAVTADHYLVAGSLEPHGLLVFDLAAGGPPVALRWPAEVEFAPWDIAPTADGGVWVLDREHERLWSLDRLFRVRAAAAGPAAPPAPAHARFAPCTPEGVTDEPMLPGVEAAGPITLDASLELAVTDATSVESLCDGSALVLGIDPIGGGPMVHRYTLEGEQARYPLFAALADHDSVRSELPHGHDLAFVAAAGCARDAIAGRLFVVAASGNQSFAFTLSGPAEALEIALETAFFPMRRFGGRALVAAGGEAWYDSGGRWISLLEYPRPTYAARAVLQLPARGGDVDGRAFDGREPGCVWHRLFLDACIPPTASVRVESRAADSPAELDAADWRAEPAPYLRTGGSELPYRRTALEGPPDQAGTWELLFQAARGRYLQLRLTLAGNGRTTPRLHALRAYYPRFSYLHRYLPAVWREDPISASFVERMLANVEGTLTGIEERIAAAQLLFDTSTVPAEFLPWLAGWLGASLDAAWDEPKRRFFVAHALRMFAARGTRDGLVRALRLALEECVDPHLFAECGCGPSGNGARASSASAGAACGCGAGGGRFTVRVIERFLSRSAPGVVWGDVGLAGPGVVATALAWTPAQGAEPLHARWREWLQGHYATVEALNQAWQTGFRSLDDHGIRLRATAPSGAAQAADWRRFLREGLGFTYVPPEPAELPLWRDFLARRYRQPEDLNRAWRRTGAAAVKSFDELEFPQELPTRSSELGDWIAFVSEVVPMRRSAHRFTVLVPVAPGDDPERQRQRRELARRIAELEKPAHTVVEARLYWAAFRVGEARLGTDTLLGRGSRFTALELGRGELAASHLGWMEPWNVRGRMVVGRDPVAVRPQPRAAPARCT